MKVLALSGFGADRFVASGIRPAVDEAVRRWGAIDRSYLPYVRALIEHGAVPGESAARFYLASGRSVSLYTVEVLP